MILRLFITVLTFTFLFGEEDSISYEKDVKPILTNRCVVCHSCYNSPCQTKLSSEEGIERGGNKTAIYENRLNPTEPSRLFLDATTTKQWREKGFFSVTQPLSEDGESIMSILLKQKQIFPQINGNYAPEKDELTCSKDLDELNAYLKEKPYHGMPYGFPALSQEEHNTLINWLSSKKKYEKNRKNQKSKIAKRFQRFLNKLDLKHQVTARYIYEHLFLAHIKFPDSDDYYELVRTYDTHANRVIATRLPYDDAPNKFYYIFRKVKSTIVHKTHMVYKMDTKKLKRYYNLFIKPKWERPIKKVSYKPEIAANPLIAFEQIPIESRYKFLLDDIHFFISTFIKGPVCKGQIALNVINDHFWIAFKDPKHDETILSKNFIKENEKNLSLPNMKGSDTTILNSLDFLEYDYATTKYYQNKNELYKNSKEELSLNSIWKGNNPDETNNDAILTIYRHFDSASVHKGAWGNIPRTMWVIDYPMLERLYYSLVAGFDVFGNTQHKVLIRKYMDRLRIEGESNFLEYLPKHKREKVFESWYQGLLAKYFAIYSPSSNHTAIKYNTINYKNELIEKLLDYTNTPKDPINYIKKDYKKGELLESYSTKEDIEKALTDTTLVENIKNYKDFSSKNFNLMYVRFKLKEEDLIYSVVINRWHDNVAFMFEEDLRLDKSKDTINILEGFIGSYPNYFAVVEEKDINQFFKLLRDYNNDESQLKKFFIRRDDPRFWETFDWFQNKFYEQEPIYSGLFDLNRYYHKAFN